MQISHSKLAPRTLARGLAGPMATVLATGVAAVAIAVLAAPRPALAQTSLPAPTHYWSFDGDDPAIDAAGGAKLEIDRASYEPGKYGKALRFHPTNGAKDVVIDGAATTAATAAPWSMGVWVYREADTKSSVLMSSDDFALKLEQWGEQHTVGITHYTVRDMDFGYRVALSTWVHVAMVGHADKTELYIDGKLHKSLPHSVKRPMRWLGSKQGYEEFLHARLDELKLFDRALSAAQVEALYEQRPGPGGPVPIHHWSFDGDQANIDSVAGMALRIDRQDWKPGKRGKALRFNLEDGAKVVTIPAGERAAPWTVSVWVYREARSTSSALLSSAAYALKLEQWPNKNGLGVTTFGKRDSTFDRSLPLNTWVHVVMVGRADRTELYIDGAPAGSLAHPVKLPMQWLGSREGYVELFQGRIDELKIYGQALTAQQVAALD